MSDQTLIVLSPETYPFIAPDGTTTDVALAALSAGSIDPASPTMDDTLSMTGANYQAVQTYRSALVAFQHQKSADGSTGWTNIATTETIADLAGAGVLANEYVRMGVSVNGGAYVYTSAVQIAAGAASAAFSEDWSSFTAGQDPVAVGPYSLVSTSGAAGDQLLVNASNNLEAESALGNFQNTIIQRTGTTLGTNHKATATFTFAFADGGELVRLYAGRADANNEIRLLMATSGAWSLVERRNGANTTVASGSVTLSGGTATLELRVNTVANTATALIDGVTVANAVDVSGAGALGSLVAIGIQQAGTNNTGKTQVTAFGGDDVA